MNTTLQIIFFGLICFFGSGNDPRLAIVFDLSKGEVVHGHKVQRHAAVIRVRSTDFVQQQTKWPCTPTANGCDFELDNRTLELSGIDDDPLAVDPNQDRLVPHIRGECPEFGDRKDDDALKSAAAANIELSRATLCAHKAEEGVVSSVYKVRTNGATVTITGKRPGSADRVIVLNPNAIIEIRNDPQGEGDDNHFIAYYKQIAAADACCTNLPFRKVGKTDTGCQLPAGHPEVISTVACSNSNYP